MFTLLYGTWSIRNNVVWRNGKRSPYIVRQEALKYLDQWEKAKPIEKRNSVRFTSNEDCWVKPSPSYIKINADYVIFYDIWWSGVGWELIDATRMAQTCVSVPLSDVFDHFSTWVLSN